MKIKKSKFSGVYEIGLKPKKDKRGFFMRTYDKKIFKKNGLNTKWVQDNHSYSKKKGTVRGLHFQLPPYGEIKLMRVSRGKIYFVFVDLRKNSRTYGRWNSLILSQDNNKMLYLPKGFALGSCTLSNNSSILYKMGQYYEPKSCGEIKWDDKDLAIDWPLAGKPAISDRDKKAISFKEFKNKFGYL